MNKNANVKVDTVKVKTEAKPVDNTNTTMPTPEVSNEPYKPAKEYDGDSERNAGETEYKKSK